MIGWEKHVLLRHYLEPGLTLDLAAQNQEAIHLLLTDLIMPGMSGWELSVHLGARIPDLPVLFMSGDAGHTLDDARDSNTPITLLEKPFTPAALAARVRAQTPNRSRRPSPFGHSRTHTVLN